MKISLKLSFIMLLLLFLFSHKLSKAKKHIVIEIDISGRIGNRGPAIFVQGINNVLPYRTNYCQFIAVKNIYPIYRRNKSNYFYLPNPRLSEESFKRLVTLKKVNKLLLGPIFVPNHWIYFPNKNIWKEKRFREILRAVKGIVVHSNRVRDHLAKKSNTIDLINKFKIVRPCTNLKPKNVNSFDNRIIDIILFEKYGAFNRQKQANQLYNLFINSSFKIKRILYGNYTKDLILKLANNSKFIIYFSFFDTGAIGLKEIQNFGVFSFSHQQDLVISKKTGFYIPELANENNIVIAYKKIIKNIEVIIKKRPNIKIISKINQEINKCQNSLNDLCKSLL